MCPMNFVKKSDREYTVCVKVQGVLCGQLTYHKRGLVRSVSRVLDESQCSRRSPPGP